MPELPEVETVVRKLRPHLERRRIVAFESRWRRNCAPSVATVSSGVVGRTVQTLSRRAKYLVASLDDGGHLLVHLRMSGRFEWLDSENRNGQGYTNAEPSHVRATFDLDSGRRLCFCDARKFGRIVYTRDLAAISDKLGVEPLTRGFTPAVLAELLQRRHRMLKPLLLDQTVVAGLGNIYTDEALFAARLHPLAASDRLRDDDVRRLYESIRAVLRKAIRHNGTSIDWIYPEGRMQRHLRVYGRGGEPCRCCGAEIEVLRVTQRSTHVCPRCQPRKKQRTAQNRRA